VIGRSVGVRIHATDFRGVKMARIPIQTEQRKALKHDHFQRVKCGWHLPDLESINSDEPTLSIGNVQSMSLPLYFNIL